MMGDSAVGMITGSFKALFGSNLIAEAAVNASGFATGAPPAPPSYFALSVTPATSNPAFYIRMNRFAIVL